MDAFLVSQEKNEIKGMITRHESANLKKRQYFRQPKIYQNNYILELQDNDQIIDHQEISDEKDPDYNILLLFYKNCDEDNNALSLLIGREKNEEDSSCCKSSEESLKDSSCCGGEVKDDDSPYFILIMIDH